MQAQIESAYLTLADELGVPVAPVGSAWRTDHRALPTLALWQGDGSHPSAAGTYLAACVYYAVVFGQSPVGLAAGPISADDAARLQEVAADTALADPARWRLE